jgi:hypothetical protein
MTRSSPPISFKESIVAAASPIDRPTIRPLIDLLHAQIQAVLGRQLVGLYVVGSLVTGDFDERVSDIDLIAALSAPLTEAAGERLKVMHANIVRQYPAWDGRIEVIYITAEHLRQPKTLDKLGKIGPGEPFHIFAVNADDWLLKWYLLRTKGVTLMGAPPTSCVAPIPFDDLLHHLRELLQHVPEWAAEEHHWGAQVYYIQTLCRALYTFKLRDFVSKQRAAEWAAQQFPQWSPLIGRALAWRAVGQPDNVDAEAALPETLRFIDFMIDQLNAL